MKKTFMAILAAGMLLAGCGNAAEDKKASAEPSESPQAAVETGAYQINADLKSAKLPDDAQNAFDKAMEGMTGVDYEPIALLARQVVSGTNYAILCKSTAVYPDAEPALEVVTVYEDLDGNTSILSMTDFDLSEIAGKDNSYEKDADATGAFETNTEYAAQDISSEIQSVFDKAFEDITGADYTLVADLGEQVVSGTNYAFLVMETPAVQDPESKWAVVTVYQDLEGNAEITSIYELDPGAYTEYNQSEAAQIATPFHEVASIEEAEKETGITINAPESLNGSDHRIIQVFDDGMIDIIYMNGEEETARVRKSTGSDDISGDYNEYASVNDVNGKTYKGDETSVYLVTWQSDGNSYAVSFEGGISQEEAEQIIGEIA